VVELRLHWAARLLLRHLWNMLNLGWGRKQVALPLVIIIVILVIRVLLISNGMFCILGLRFDFFLMWSLSSRAWVVISYCFIIYLPYNFLQSINCWCVLSSIVLFIFLLSNLNFWYFIHTFLNPCIFLNLFEDQIASWLILTFLILIVSCIIVTEIELHIHLILSVVWLGVTLSIDPWFLSIQYSFRFVFILLIHFWIYYYDVPR